jgi:hypothetical protein
MAEDQLDRYRILGIHAYAPHGQLDRHAQRDLNKLAAEGWRVVAATGWALILEQEASPARAEAAEGWSPTRSTPAASSLPNPA